MAAGGVVSRPTPYDVVFAPLADAFADVRTAAARAGRDPREPAVFGGLAEAQRLLARLQTPDLERDPAAAEAYLAVLYAAFRFWAAGEVVMAPSRAALEPALEGPAGPPPVIPGGACYLQLPSPWFWARADAAGPHEPLDGCFLAAGARGDAVSVVAILGFRPERGGFTQVALEAPRADFTAAAGARRAPPFAPLMDGGAAAGFRSVATAGELLALVSLALVAARR